MKTLRNQIARALRRALTSSALGACAVAGLALTQGNAQAGQRPISDFLSRQGAWQLVLNGDGTVNCADSYYGASGGFLYDAPIPNFVDWTDPQNTTSSSFDYAGLVNETAGGALGTSTSGSIDEIPQADGSVTVKINLHTDHELAWATTGFAAGGTDLFGHTGVEVLDGESPSFGSSTLTLVIQNPAAGQPLPDMMELLNGCGSWTISSIHFVGSAKGTLPDGHTGELEVTETGLLTTYTHANPKSRVGLDAFPAEHINIHQTGN